jgi:DNA-binding response OmpR family regulator
MLKKLLVVDDDDGVRELVCMALGGEYEVIEARQGGEGLRLARHHRPDLVFLDVLLPDISGIQVCRVMKSDPDLASTPVVMLTSMDQASDFGDATDAGADDYITKPFALATLSRTARNVLGGP